MTRPRYDVALSFAGEQRSYVDRVANFLRANGISLFYDRLEQYALWGKDLVEELDLVYRKNSRLVIMFISAEYKRKQWTSHERRSALAAALQHRREYVLPVRFDDTDLAGLPPTIFYIHADQVGPEALGTMVIEKLRLLERSYDSSVGSLEVWRLARSRFAASAFTGEGAERLGGRWTQPGVRVVYASSSVCVALLETFARIPGMQLPGLSGDFVAVKARLSLSTDIAVIRLGDLPIHWFSFPAPAEIQDLGTQWAERGETCVLDVPSAVLPSERVYLLNPAHIDFKSLVVVAEEPVANLASFFIGRSPNKAD